MKKHFAILAALALVLTACEPYKDNYAFSVEELHRAEAQHPDKEFGIVQHDQNDRTLGIMLEQKWSVYQTIPGYVGGGGWPYLLLQRSKAAVAVKP